MSPAVDADGEFRVGGRSPRLVDEVTRRLRELILTHRLPAGAKLVQTELAERLGVSRTPLREAIRLLEQDGLVRVANGNRTLEVVKLTPRELKELYEIREVIDGLAARLLARRGMTPEVEAAIGGSLTCMFDTIYPLQGEAFFTAHVDFHAAIVDHCGNTRLRSQLQLVRMTAASLRDEFPTLVREGPGTSAASAQKRAGQSNDEHRAIFDAIKERDESGAEQAARAHIAGTIVGIVERLVDDDESTDP
jgi:GntR family transcriptional regulator of vanillate catabolism